MKVNRKYEKVFLREGEKKLKASSSSSSSKTIITADVRSAGMR